MTARPAPASAVLSPEQQALVVKHRPYAVRCASKYFLRGYTIEDIVAEACVGLVEAARRFDPSRGLLFITYAGHWIHACIMNFITRNIAPVKIATNSNDRKAFFGLSRARQAVGDDSEAIARYLKVPIEAVERMRPRLAPDDPSFDAYKENHMAALGPSPEAQVAAAESYAHTRQRMRSFVRSLEKRERRIIEARYFREVRLTLSELGREMEISRERVRQLEARALRQIEEMVMGDVELRRARKP